MEPNPYESAREQAIGETVPGRWWKWLKDRAALLGLGIAISAVLLAVGPIVDWLEFYGWRLWQYFWSN